MESLWRKQTGTIVTEHKNTEEQWDVIVIGAGLAGLLTAYYLKEQGKKVLVLEAKTTASGQTERTTAKITSQHDLKYKKMITQIGEEKARLYAQANEAAIREYERFIHTHEIFCDFEKTEAYLYTRANAKGLEEEAQAAARLGIDAFFTEETELPFPVAGAVGFRNQARFSPLEFVKYLASELEIREYTKVIDIKGTTVVTEAGAELTAENIVVAAHYPIRNLPGFYFLRQHQERSYVLALSGCSPLKGMYIGTDPDGLSFRQAGDYLLLGGAGHRTGENSCGGSYEQLRNAAKQYYPKGKEEFHWSAQDCMPHDGIPFIGKYSVFTPHLYVATGFQKWGMTTSMVAALLLKDEICGIHNPYSDLFSPQRFLIRAGIKNWIVDMGVSIKGLFEGWILRKKPKCAHMGCALNWNPEEESWDCSCHGSRFDVDRNLQDNPSKYDIK